VPHAETVLSKIEKHEQDREREKKGNVQSDKKGRNVVAPKRRIEHKVARLGGKRRERTLSS
jgi:hypothetical protein